MFLAPQRARVVEAASRKSIAQALISLAVDCAETREKPAW
jgi:hypothetical protein